MWNALRAEVIIENSSPKALKGRYKNTSKIKIKEIAKISGKSLLVIESRSLL